MTNGQATGRRNNKNKPATNDIATGIAYIGFPLPLKSGNFISLYIMTAVIAVPIATAAIGKLYPERI